ncbi:MAG: non-homologous end-joining DNA ligase [Bacteroidota bacterium]
MKAFGEKIPHYIKPMLTTAVDQPFSSEEWLFELKLDGYRAVAEIKKGKSLLYSRNGISLAGRFPSIMAAVKNIKTEAVLDGEIVMLNEEGKPDFQKLQNYGENDKYPVVYYVFDLLSLMRKDLTELPLQERKKLLKKMLPKKGLLVYSSHIETDGKELYKQIKKGDLEGIIAKKKDSRYNPGTRSREWLKIKNHKSQEAIIIGYTEPKGGRLHFGSLLLAQYKNKKLVYAGHAGTGFPAGTLAELMKKMKPLATKKPPFAISAKANGPVTWIKPKLVCEISYTEITKDGIMRHPVYKGLRPEKKSKTIKKETEQPLPVKKIVTRSSKT